MAFQEKKFLDAEGVTHLVKLLDEYPNNQILGSVIDAIEGELAEKAEKSEIPNVPVQDVQVNGVSAIQNGILQFGSGNGFSMASNGNMFVQCASDGQVKDGTNRYRPIVPSNQEKSVFYGLAKAAGDTTQSQSDNAVGTYTIEAKAAIRSMIGAAASADIPTNVSELMNDSGYMTMVQDESITKEKLALTLVNELNGKVKDPDHTEIESIIVNTESVTTTSDQAWESPHGTMVATGRFLKGNHFNVTFDGTSYDIESQLIFVGVNKVAEFLGNIKLYEPNVSGFMGKIYNVPFFLISDISGTNVIDILTPESGTHSVKITSRSINGRKLDNDYIYNDAYAPLEYISHDNSTYSKISLGGANRSTERGSMSFGYGNVSSGFVSIAAGFANEASGTASIAIGNQTKAINLGAYAEGYMTTASGERSHAEGHTTTASGPQSHAEGSETTASSNYTHAEGEQTQATNRAAHSEGRKTIASGENSHAEGYLTEANGYGSHAGGMASIANGMASIAHGINSIANKGCQAVFGKNNIIDNSQDTFGTYIFILGNGASKTAKSNAFAVDWSGDGKFAGNVYAGCGADSSGGTMLPKDVQVNGASVVDQSGIVNIPVVTGDGSVALGLVKPSNGNGTAVTSKGSLAIVKAEDNHIKIAADEYRPIVPKKQHISTFYGLAKAAGDTTQSASSNAVGTYTDEAKAAIQAMLGIDLSSIASQVEIPLVETVSGAAVTITGQPNTRYMCGEVTSISITPPAAGSIDVVFTSGSTVAVLTLPSTVKMPEWFDASTLDTNTVYEILITDGVYGSVMTWAT